MLQAFDSMIREISNALVEADVNIKLVAGLRNSIKKTVNFKELGAGVNKKRIIPVSYTHLTLPTKRIV